MSYSVASRGNVTMIDDLPELSDVESGGYGRGPPRQINIPQNMPPPGHIPEGVLSPEMAQKLQRHVRQRHAMIPEAGMSSYNQPVEQSDQQENYEQPAPSFNPVTGMSCLDAHGHVTQCPICSRFFNNDKTILYVIIVVLTIICLLLLKKVLDL